MRARSGVGALGGAYKACTGARREPDSGGHLLFYFPSHPILQDLLALLMSTGYHSYVRTRAQGDSAIRRTPMAS
eukprot:scaffold117122_cov27-Phaeocystis_antarctica.AAC.2